VDSPTEERKDSSRTGCDKNGVPDLGTPCGFESVLPAAESTTAPQSKVRRTNPLKSPASASGGKMIFDFGYGALALDGKSESSTSFQRFYAHNLALPQKSDGTAQ
jgi:hypothetical protein